MDAHMAAADGMVQLDEKIDSMGEAVAQWGSAVMCMRVAQQRGLLQQQQHQLAPMLAGVLVQLHHARSHRHVGIHSLMVALRSGLCLPASRPVCHLPSGAHLGHGFRDAHETLNPKP